MLMQAQRLPTCYGVTLAGNHQQQRRNSVSEHDPMEHCGLERNCASAMPVQSPAGHVGSVEIPQSAGQRAQHSQRYIWPIMQDGFEHIASQHQRQGFAFRLHGRIPGQRFEDRHFPTIIFYDMRVE